MVEKVRAPDARFQDIINQVYFEYKISQGYTDNEIIAKSRSLKGVLEPFSSKIMIDRKYFDFPILWKICWSKKLDGFTHTLT